MAAIEALSLIARADAGEKLTAEERRHAIGYLIWNNDVEPTNTELAAKFGVSNRTITDDRRYLREQAAEEIKTTDVALIVADVELAFKRTMRNIEKSAAKAKLGTLTYLQHQTAAFKLQMDYLNGMQSLGIYPKELGTIHQEKFEFSAQVGMELNAQPRDPRLFDGKQLPILEAEVLDLEHNPERRALTDGQNQSKTEHGTTGAEQHSVANSGEAGQPDASSSAQLPAVQAH